MKVTILGGGGGVGASAAFNLLLAGDGHDVVLADPRQNMALSHALDLEQTLELGARGSVRVGDDTDVLDADLLVFAAGVPLRPEASRADYLADHVPIARDLAELLRGAGDGWHGVLLVVTNPLDPLCTLLHRWTGIERGRIVGYTLNDSLRLRTGVARALGVERGSVEAWVLGEHGDTSVPLLGRVRVAGRPVELTEGQRAAAEEFLRTWYTRQVALESARSSTWTSGLGIARIAHALAHPSDDVWPASVVLDGEYGIEGVSIGVPVSLGSDGVERIHEWALAPAERVALERSAALVADLVTQVEQS